MNDFFVDGNLTKDPELGIKQNGEPVVSPTGKRVLNFSIAHNKRVKKGDDWEDQPHFFEADFWTEKPTYWIQKLTKGAGVVLHCEANQDRWEKEGVKHSRIKFSCVEPPRLLSRGDLSAKPIGGQADQTPDTKEQFDDNVPF